MRQTVRFAVACLAASLAAIVAPPACAAADGSASLPGDRMVGLTIIAPAGPGGGWDQTAHAMRDAVLAGGLAADVAIVNVPGAGGTVALARFVNEFKTNARALMVSGLVMAGAVQTNRVPVSLDQIVPIARLTGEFQVIAVPAGSAMRGVPTLVVAMRDDPGAVTWAGGSAGGVDHILVALLARAIGVEPRRVRYLPFSGGGEALAALLGGRAMVGVSGWNEFEPAIRDGRLRALALSSPERVPGIAVPTLREQGVDVELMNWRGVVAPPGISDAQRQALGAMVGRMVQGDRWRAILKARSWLDLYQSPDQFAAFIRVERVRIEEVLRDLGFLR